MFLVRKYFFQKNRKILKQYGRRTNIDSNWVRPEYNSEAPSLELT